MMNKTIGVTTDTKDVDTNIIKHIVDLVPSSLLTVVEDDWRELCVSRLASGIS